MLGEGISSGGGGLLPAAEASAGMLLRSGGTSPWPADLAGPGRTAGPAAGACELRGSMLVSDSTFIFPAGVKPAGAAAPQAQLGAEPSLPELPAADGVTGGRGLGGGGGSTWQGHRGLAISQGAPAASARAAPGALARSMTPLDVAGLHQRNTDKLRLLNEVGGWVLLQGGGGEGGVGRWW